MSDLSEIEASLREKVGKLLEKNHKVGTKNGVAYDYTSPSSKDYPHQWLWDSCFLSIVLTHFDTERAKTEIRTLLATQKGGGYIPCVSIWKKRFPLEDVFYLWRITQPPMIAVASEIIYKKIHDKKFIEEIYPRLSKYMNWLADIRDQNHNGLVEVIHPWEDGDDSNPSFDKQLGIKNSKPGTFENFYSFYKVFFKYTLLGWDEIKIYKSGVFRMETVLFNSIYALAALAMSNLAKAINKNDDAEKYLDRYRRTREALLNLCWNEKDKIFYDLDRNGRQIRIKNTSSLMPLILPDLPEKIYKPLIEKHLLNKKEFWSPVPITSVSQDESTFNPGKSLVLWRGPMWVNANWFLSKALINYGYKKKAEELVRRTSEVVDKYGFWEFYNPLTGDGYGQPDFGWSTLVLDMLRM